MADVPCAELPKRGDQCQSTPPGEGVKSTGASLRECVSEMPPLTRAFRLGMAETPAQTDAEGARTASEPGPAAGSTRQTRPVFPLGKATRA